MITTVRFDVHGANARELRERAMTTLIQFTGDAVTPNEWTITVEATQEAVSVADTVVMWRGEVEARHHHAPSDTSHTHEWRDTHYVVMTNPPKRTYVCACGAVTHDPATGKLCPIAHFTGPPDDR